jgi:hypothetical protein
MFKKFKKSLMSRSLSKVQDDVVAALASIEDVKDHTSRLPVLSDAQASILDQIDREWKLQQAAYARSKVERDLLINANTRINFEQDLIGKVRTRLIAEKQSEKLTNLRTEAEIQAEQLEKERIELEEIVKEKEVARFEIEERESKIEKEKLESNKKRIFKAQVHFDAAKRAEDISRERQLIDQEALKITQEKGAIETQLLEVLNKRSKSEEEAQLAATLREQEEKKLIEIINEKIQKETELLELARQRSERESDAEKNAIERVEKEEQASIIHANRLAVDVSEIEQINKRITAQDLLIEQANKAAEIEKDAALKNVELINLKQIEIKKNQEKLAAALEVDLQLKNKISSEKELMEQAFANALIDAEAEKYAQEVVVTEQLKMQSAEALIIAQSEEMVKASQRQLAEAQLLEQIEKKIAAENSAKIATEQLIETRQQADYFALQRLEKEKELEATLMQRQQDDALVIQQENLAIKAEQELKIAADRLIKTEAEAELLAQERVASSRLAKQIMMERLQLENEAKIFVGQKVQAEELLLVEIQEQLEIEKQVEQVLLDKRAFEKKAFEQASVVKEAETLLLITQQENLQSQTHLESLISERTKEELHVSELQSQRMQLEIKLSELDRGDSEGVVDAGRSEISQVITRERELLQDAHNAIATEFTLINDIKDQIRSIKEATVIARQRIIRDEELEKVVNEKREFELQLIDQLKEKIQIEDSIISAENKKILAEVENDNTALLREKLSQELVEKNTYREKLGSVVTKQESLFEDGELSKIDVDNPIVDKSDEIPLIQSHRHHDRDDFELYLKNANSKSERTTNKVIGVLLFAVLLVGAYLYWQNQGASSLKLENTKPNLKTTKIVPTNYPRDLFELKLEKELKFDKLSVHDQAKKK